MLLDKSSLVCSSRHCCVSWGKESMETSNVMLLGTSCTHEALLNWISLNVLGCPRVACLQQTMTSFDPSSKRRSRTFSLALAGSHKSQRSLKRKKVLLHEFCLSFFFFFSLESGILEHHPSVLVELLLLLLLLLMSLALAGCSTTPFVFHAPIFR